MPSHRLTNIKATFVYTLYTYKYHLTTEYIFVNIAIDNLDPYQYIPNIYVNLFK